MKTKRKKEKVCEYGNLENGWFVTKCGHNIFLKMKVLSDYCWKFCPFCGNRIKEVTNEP